MDADVGLSESHGIVTTVATEDGYGGSGGKSVSATGQDSGEGGYVTGFIFRSALAFGVREGNTEILCQYVYHGSGVAADRGYFGLASRRQQVWCLCGGRHENPRWLEAEP